LKTKNSETFLAYEVTRSNEASDWWLVEIFPLQLGLANEMPDEFDACSFLAFNVLP
jgi:hypothetical protein